MDFPVSVRIGRQGVKLAKVCRKSGLKQPEVIKLALAELFKAYPNDKALALAVFNFRLAEAAK